MTVCDWCKAEGKMLFNTSMNKSPNRYDNKTIQLCRQCRTILEKYEGKALYDAAIAAKSEVEGKEPKRKRRWCFR